MEALINFFTSLTGVISNIIDFVVDFIGQMLDLVVMLGEAAIAIPVTFAIFPPPATIALGSILTIAIAYKMLGRE